MFLNGRSVAVIALLFPLLIALPVAAQTMPQSRERTVDGTRKQPESPNKPSAIRLVEPPGAELSLG